MADRSDIEFFFDPICPFAWITSRWITEVAPLRGATHVAIHLLAVVNEGKGLAAEFPPAYPVLHGLGRDLLRVAAAAREAGGNEAVAAFYTAAGQQLHVGRVNVGLWKGEPVSSWSSGHRRRCRLLDPGLVAAAGRPPPLRRVCSRDETELALSRTGPDVGTPILTFDPGQAAESSLFGPVISKAPRGADGLELFDAVRTLAHTPAFASPKR